jgi:hypothetical protein
MLISIRSTGSLRAAVTDGVTIGHPCCGFHDCKEPLTTQRDKHCCHHQHLNNTCAVTTCSNNTDGRHQTCSQPGHRILETRGVEAHTALFQLRRRLERLKIYHPGDETSSSHSEDNAAAALADGEVVEIEAEVQGHPDKPEAGNQKPRARFGRRRTHNEELCVATCGIIFGRATMYGSEGPNGVRVSKSLQVQRSFSDC